MASISNDPNGTRRILFTRPCDSKRVAIRLGKMPMKEARTVLAHVEALVTCAIAGTSMSDETARWVASIGDRLHASLSEHGIASARRRMRLGEFLAGYQKGRKDVKSGTLDNYRTMTNRLLVFFDPTRYLHEITQGDADAWLVDLRARGYAGATIGKTVKQARSFFRSAVRSGLIGRNPFEGLKAPSMTNTSRLFYVSRAIIEKAIAATPDPEWKLIIALARYGGLRTPSEHQALEWADVNWAENKFRAFAPKTEDDEAGGERWVPIFPELRPYLEDSFERAEPGTVHVIQRYRDPGVNLRSQFKRILRCAGVASWPRLWQNLRSSCEVDLLRQFPLPVVCSWIGHSAEVAMKHYHQMTNEDYTAAAGVGDAVDPNRARNCAQSGAENEGKPGKSETPKMQKTSISARETEVLAISKVTPTGSERQAATTSPPIDLRKGDISGSAELCADRDKTTSTDDLLAMGVLTMPQADME